MSRLALPIVIALGVLLALPGALAVQRTAVAASTPSVDVLSCVPSTGPGIAPPSSVPSGIPGFHASWYGQSGYPTLCPGQRTIATVAFYNSGTRGWVAGRMGEMAYLGTWDPVSAREGESALGGTGGDGPNTGWPAPNRAAAQPVGYVGPNQIAWFQFTIEAPTEPGTYRLYLRPVIEGATWMEDHGVFWEVRVSGSRPEPLALIPTAPASGPIGWTRDYTAVVSEGACVDLAFVDALDVAADGSVAQVGGEARLSRFAMFAVVNGATSGAPFISCAAVGPTRTARFTISSSAANVNVRPVVFVDVNGNDALDVGTEPYALGGAVHFLPAPAASGTTTVIVDTFSIAEQYFVDTNGPATYRYDTNDVFTRGGMPVTMAWFQMLLSRGDVLSVTYASNADLPSTFAFIRDAGREVPALQPALDSWDGGAVQNDVGIRVIEPASNVDGVAYVIERARNVSGAACLTVSGYATLGTLDIPAGADERVYVDRDVPVGAYCYRIGVSDLLSAQTIYTYAQVLVPNPPAPVTFPRSLDARIAVSAGSPAALDAGDVIKIAFDEHMSAPVLAGLLLSDVDGTVAELRCGVDGLVCYLNTGTEDVGGVAYELGTVLTMELRAAPRVLTAGSLPGLQSHATILAGELTDAAANGWDVGSSEDVVIGAPD